MRTKLALGRALMSGPEYSTLAPEVQEACELAAALVWETDDDEEEEDDDEADE